MEAAGLDVSKHGGSAYVEVSNMSYISADKSASKAPQDMI